MSNEATSIYSTWFSDESAGYCDRSLWALEGFLARGADRDDSRECEDEWEPCDSLRVEGWGERACLFLVDIEDGDREDGKEENEG